MSLTSKNLCALLLPPPPPPPPQSFEALNPRAVSIVIDPIQSVKGKVVIDAFRLIDPKVIMLQQEPRQTTSNLGHLHKPSIQALIHGLNRHYYSIAINYRKNELEQKVCVWICCPVSRAANKSYCVQLLFVLVCLLSSLAFCCTSLEGSLLTCTALLVCVWRCVL